MTNNNYHPPFQMTEEITHLIVEIGEYVGMLSVLPAALQNPMLRRANRIKTIHSSLAIEHNSLMLEQVTDVIEGKHVWGPAKEIREVQNAYEAYEHLMDSDPYDIHNLLYAHRLMMAGLIKDAGKFRSGNVGVYAGEQLVHPGSPAKLVPDLMAQLMYWLKTSQYHPLVKSCIFHYEFEFIHPFSDGNGRTGRLWQSLILRNWKDIFMWLPVETLVHRHQQDYYHAIHLSNRAGNATPFVTFMLTMIRNALKELQHEQAIPNDVVRNTENVVRNTENVVRNTENVVRNTENVVRNTENVVRNVGDVVTNEARILSMLQKNGALTARDLAASLELTYRQVQRIMVKLKAAGCLVRHGATKNGYWEVVEQYSPKK